MHGGASSTLQPSAFTLISAPIFLYSPLACTQTAHLNGFFTLNIHPITARRRYNHAVDRAGAALGGRVVCVDGVGWLRASSAALLMRSSSAALILRILRHLCGTDAHHIRSFGALSIQRVLLCCSSLLGAGVTAPKGEGSKRPPVWLGWGASPLLFAVCCHPLYWSTCF